MHWQNLMSYLLIQEQRKSLEKLIKQIRIEQPYDNILNTLYSVEGDLTKAEFLQLIAGKVNSDTLMVFNDMPESVSRTVAFAALKEIEAEQTLGKIVKIIKTIDDPEQKINKIRKLSEQRLVKPPAQSRSIYEFETQDVLDILNICDYPCSKEELVTLVAYSGRGKTTIMLSLIRLACELGMKCLYITIADWSESMLKHRIKRASNFPDFNAVCYSECDIHRIETEIDAVRPDLAVVDYLDVIAPENPFDAYRFQLMNNAKHLKRIAAKYNTLVVTGKQSNADDEIITADHLAEAKQGIIAQSDLVLGFGKHPSYENTLVCNTIKARRHRIIDGLLDVKIDHRNFEID